MTSLATIAGPPLGGWLVQAFSWRAIFFINIPIAAVTLLIIWRTRSSAASEAASDPRPIDWAGTVLITIALATLTYALIQAPVAHRDRFGALMVAAFAVSETTDNLLGAWVRGRVPEAVRVVGTNLVSTPLDSVVFIVLAFGTGKLDLVKGQFVAKMEATVLIGLPLVLAARRFFSHASGQLVAQEVEA